MRAEKTADIQQQRPAQPKKDTVVLKTITEKTVTNTTTRESAVQPQAPVTIIQGDQELAEDNADRITGLQAEIEALKMQLLSQEKKVEPDTVDAAAKDTIVTQPRTKESEIDSVEFKALQARIEALQSEIDSLQKTAITKMIPDTVVVKEAKQESETEPVTVYFERNSSVVEDRYKEYLADFAKAYLALSKPAMALVTGYADKIGNHDYNKILSERRALAVKKVLMVNQISDDRIIIRSFGDEKAEPGKDEMERKVEVKVLYQE